MEMSKDKVTHSLMHSFIPRQRDQLSGFRTIASYLLLLRAGKAGGWQRHSVWVPTSVLPRPLSWGTAPEDPPPPATATSIPITLASCLSGSSRYICPSLSLSLCVCVSLPFSLCVSLPFQSLSLSLSHSHTHTHTHSQEKSLGMGPPPPPSSATFIPQSSKSLLWVPHSLTLHYIRSATLSHPQPPCHPIPDDLLSAYRITLTVPRRDAQPLAVSHDAVYSLLNCPNLQRRHSHSTSRNVTQSLTISPRGPSPPVTSYTTTVRGTTLSVKCRHTHTQFHTPPLKMPC